MSFTNYGRLTEEYCDLSTALAIGRGSFQDQDELFVNIENPLEFIIENNVISTSTVMVKADVFSQTDSFNADIKYAEISCGLNEQNHQIYVYWLVQANGH